MAGLANPVVNHERTAPARNGLMGGAVPWGVFGENLMPQPSLTRTPRRELSAKRRQHGKGQGGGKAKEGGGKGCFGGKGKKGRKKGGGKLNERFFKENRIR